IESTIRSGIDSGVKKPRELPPELTNHQPGPAVTVPDEWPEPIPLGALPPPALFPIAVFPAPFRQMVVEGAAALHCPVDYLAVRTAAAVAEPLGTSRALEIKKAHTQGARLYAAVIGPPGSAKTPGIDLAFAPLHTVEDAWITDWLVKMEEHKAA